MAPQSLNDFFMVLSIRERTILYIYTLIPVCAVALLLFFTVMLRARHVRSLAIYCLSLACWSLLLLVIYFPRFAFLGQRLAAFGTVVAAAYVHVAYDFTRQTRYHLVWVVYGVAISLTALGVLRPGALYHPLSLTAGPLFLPAMALSAIAVLIPMSHIALSYEVIEKSRRSQLWALFASGVLCFLGSWWHVWLLAEGILLPYGMILVLGSLFLLSHVITGYQAPRDRRLLERSFLYSAVAALLSAGFLFAVLTLLTQYFDILLSEYRISVFFFLCMAALAFEPLRQFLQESFSQLFAPDRTPLSHIAQELEKQEKQADQARRLAELGTFTSAIAHEVRNPLGVIAAHLRLLERQGIDSPSLGEIREQLQRAEHFLNDLLAYGRPRPLVLRQVDLYSLVALAVSTAQDGLREAVHGVDWQIDCPEEIGSIEVDQSQLLQVLVILLENALLALQEVETRRISIRCKATPQTYELCMEDSGPGIPPELQPRLFEPFVTGRQRSGPHMGTGLGLAIARGMIERHHGTIRAGTSNLGGASFTLTLPRTQSVLAVTCQPTEPSR